MLVRVEDYHWLDGEEKAKCTMKTRKAGSTGEEGKRGVEGPFMFRQISES